MFLFLSTLVAAIIAFLGFLAVLHAGKSVTSRIFFVHTLVIAVWSIVNYVSIAVSPEHALPWIRLVITLAVPHVFIFFLFVLNFPNEKLVIKTRDLILTAAAGIVYMILAETRLVFSGLEVIDGQAVPQIGPMMPFFGASIVLLSLTTFVLIIRKYFKTQGEERGQWRDISFGLLLSYTCIFGFIFLPVVLYQDTSFVAYSAVFVLPIFVGSTYAIMRHGFLNIKLIATEIFTFLLIFASVWQILLAQNQTYQIMNGLVTVLLLGLSILLIRSVLLEVRQREQLQKLSQQLSDANGQLLQLDKAKNEFLSIASHQLRTPLTAIKGYASMFVDGDFGEMTPPQKENMNLIFRSADRLSVLVSDLLDLSRIESGRMEFVFEAADLCKIVEDVILEVTPKAKAKNLYLYFDNVNRSCPEVRADKEKLRQVVINLIDNAVKYTEHGGVTVRVMRHNNELQMSVIDTGIGIDPNDSSRMFEKFFRAGNANKITSEGTGLGVYVAKKIVEAQGGKLWFESAGLGKGTTFNLTIPIPQGKIKQERVNIASMEAF